MYSFRDMDVYRRKPAYFYDARLTRISCCDGRGEMAKDDVIEQISLFQRKLEKYAKSGETDKVLYYIHKLKYLQVTVKHLEATGVGRTVNSLRHHSGLVGNKARDLVSKWKKMVSAEESEEEEEEEEDDDVEYDKRTDGDNDVALRDQNGDDMEDDEEDDRLQIEENGSESNVPVPEYRPTPGDHDIGGDSPGGGNDNSYNPLTSKMDYQLLNTATQSREYHPSSIDVNDSHYSSPEDVTSGYEDASPSTSADRRNEGSSKSSKKSSREDKEKHKKKEKNREKERSKESSSSHEKEKRKDHKHKAKHKEKDKEKDREEKKKNKSHKHKEKDRHEEKTKDRKSEESDEKPKVDKDKKHHVVNGYGALDSGESKKCSVKQDRESEKRDLEEKRKEKISISSGSSSSSSSHRKEERYREKEIIAEKESSDSEQEVLSKESRVKDSSKDREKSKHHDRHSSSSSKKDKLKQDHESQREEEGKKKKSKKSKEEENDFGALLMGFDSPSKKKKKKKKKDRKERDSSDDEQPSSSKSHKRALADGEIIEPSSSKSHKRTLTDGEIPEPKKPKLLETTPQKLPKLPASLPGSVLEAPLLPEITPNYKPLPRVPVRDEPANLIHSKMSEEETLNIMLQSKSGRRSKMYSGRSTGLQYVPTLYDSCIRVMIDNIDAIEATGNVPYDILRPVLERASAQQLMNIEDFNPYLLEDTDPLWENHCRKDFRNKKLEDMETWRELWWRCHEEREKKFKSLTETLQQKFISKAEPKRQIKLAFVNDTIKVPKNVARAQAKYGTATPSGSAVKPGKANEIAARKTAMQNAQRAEKAAAAPRPTSAKNKKVAPLMAKTRQFYKKAFRR